ncbi:SEC14-like protein 2 isoform X2 [Amphiura filiformis]|uniref:SEC14-like protein 2 isoform X2 n=1 Tax=Amphiura filiformis TaxID=82378 RepID=UPI003B21AA90
MSGRPELTGKQKEKLIQFRANLKDVLGPKHDDYYLTRFLRARNFDLAKSEEMLRNCLIWREKMKIDTIQQDFKLPEVADKYWAGGVLDGYDKDDCPVWLVPIGNFDPKGLLHSMKHGDLIKVNLLVLEYQYEQFAIRTKEIGKQIGQLTLIVDLENLGLQHLWKPGIELFTKVLMIMEKNYPDTLRRILVVRAPAIFPVAYTLIKPFLQEYTRRKLKVLGSNWRDVLRQHVDKDILPEYWGGTKKDPDGNPKCPSLIKQGGEVPKSYYKTEFDLTQKGMITKDISRAGALELKYEVHKPASVLRYTFKTYDNDIGFGVTLNDVTSKKPIVVMENKRHNSHMVPEDGELILEKPGTYTVKFDNSYSWTKGKAVSYLLEVLEPTDEEPNFVEQTAELDLNK